MPKPRIFISYAWESDEYRDLVERLATRLREDGIDARLDRWHLGEGVPIPDFMSREVRHADRVLVLCSPGFREKVHRTEDGKGATGVGWESRLLTTQVFVGVEGADVKGIAVLMRGAWKEAAPDFLLGDPYTDLTDDKTFESHYRELLQRLTGKRKQAPPIGDLPHGLEDEPAEPLRGVAPATGEDGEGSPSGASDVCMQFTLAGERDGPFSVEAKINEGHPVNGPFDLDIESVDSPFRKEVETIEANSCEAEDLLDLGAELWTRLRGGDIEEAVARAIDDFDGQSDAKIKIRLSLPPALEGLPWEALHDMTEQSLATSPRFSVVRVPYVKMPAPIRRTQADTALKMLVVIPSGSGLQTAAELSRIRQAIQVAGDAITLTILDGHVTVNTLAAKLRDGWDIVHFIGHGCCDDLGRVKLRLNAERMPDNDEGGDEDQWIPALTFAEQFRRTQAQLIVVNCCKTGAVQSQPLNTLGGLGTELMKARVPAVLVMRYEIVDAVAADFSGAFYTELVAGTHPGRVDLAVQEGRAALARTYPEGERVRSYVTPVLYLAEDCERLFDRLDGVRAGEAAVTAAEAPIDPRIPPKLVYALQSGRCLPILGQGILSASAVRKTAIASGPRGLLHHLGKQSKFPGCDRVTALADNDAAWLAPILFKRICQHFESVSLAERAGLTSEIRKACTSKNPVPPLLEGIATWRVPGLVYCHVDGLLERALQDRIGKNLRIVRPDNISPGTKPAGDLVEMLSLRGSHTVPDSMILTEQDEDAIIDMMPVFASFCQDLMHQRAPGMDEDSSFGGCSLLFIGVSPRDPLVRALGRVLLQSDIARNRGTAYFVDDTKTIADEAYWKRFDKLEWVEIDPGAALAGLSAAATRPPEGGA